MAVAMTASSQSTMTRVARKYTLSRSALRGEVDMEHVFELQI